MDYKEWRRRDTRELLWIVHSRAGRIEAMLRRIQRTVCNLEIMEGIEMATLDEFKQSLTDMQSELARNADTEASAAEALHTLADHLVNGAASATDLDELKTLVTGMASSVHANADTLAAAIADTSGSSSGTAPP